MVRRRLDGIEQVCQKEQIAMERTMSSLPIAYRLQADTQIRASGDGVVVTSPACQVTIAHLSPQVRQVLLRLAQTSCSLNWIGEALRAAQAENQLSLFYQYISCLL